ncbi:MAG: BON domain-containing protein [Acidobacteria bacterium]|nr:BON domain-containing protein [Acidobacteriota bacterium]
MKRNIPFLVVLIFSIVFSSGCALLLVGGAGAGGYYVGKDKRPVGQIAEDARITAEINRQYIADSVVSARKVDVDTYMGVVTLWGNLPSRKAVDRAVSIAESVKGVIKVISKLKVIPD